MARADYESLTKVWRHSALGRKWKLSIYHSLVESKLLYGLATMCLNIAQRRRLDGFQNRCLRKILGILPSYYSMVTNASVLQRAACKKASSQLEARQLILLGKVIRADVTNPLRSSCLVENTLRPLTSHFIRRVGRPRKEWITTVLPQALLQAGGSDTILTQLVQVPILGSA